MKLSGLRAEEESGTLHVAVTCVDMQRKAGGEGGSLVSFYAEARKPGEQTGLDTPVVLAVNDGHYVAEDRCLRCLRESIKCPAWGVRSQV